MIVALGQLNPIVGDIEGNIRLASDAIGRAKEAGADLIVLPELVTLGYPPKDLLLREGVVQRNLDAIERIAQCCTGIAAIVGYVARNESGGGLRLQNAAAFCADGRVRSTHIKSLLPNYDVFDERRYFQPADTVKLCHWDSPRDGRIALGITICEDLWNDEQFIDREQYRQDPIEQLAQQGADLLINISASPFWVGKQLARRDIFARQVREHRVPLVFVNQVGGNDDLIFDGGSMAFDREGMLIAQAKAFEEDLVVLDLANPADSQVRPYPEETDSLIEGLALGTRDYVRKCGFSEVIIGLSGGIDSSVCAAIAARALGPEALHGVAMPSRYSSAHSLQDAEILARNLGIDFRIIDIKSMHQASESTLKSSFAGSVTGIAEENLQARIRGLILMALSNKFGWLPLATGNKSELAVGYCTLYGDMCGGLAVLSDVAKTAVYEIARRMNCQAGHEVIPNRVLTKPPSAELRPNQTDQDSLPPYEQLDAILAGYVERHESAEQIIAAGFEPDVVVDVLRRVDRNEYKRRQAPPGLKVTSRAFGAGWRMPIAARFESLPQAKQIEEQSRRH
ncbi:MAG: NAD+ synthase [Planctomycetes bacterium]|nr:NAD+ synthase [Planctomycetota bacterium]